MSAATTAGGAGVGAGIGFAVAGKGGAMLGGLLGLVLGAVVGDQAVAMAGEYVTLPSLLSTALPPQEAIDVVVADVASEAPVITADVLPEQAIVAATLYNNGIPYTDGAGTLWTWDQARMLWVGNKKMRSGGYSTKPDPNFADTEAIASVLASQQAFMAYKAQYGYVAQQSPSTVAGDDPMPNPKDFYLGGKFRKAAYESALKTWKRRNSSATSKKWADTLEGLLDGVGKGFEDAAGALVKLLAAG